MNTTQLTESQQAEIILMGIQAKIDQSLESAERSKMMGNLTQWANYLAVAARWAEKLVEVNTEINRERVGA